MTATKEYRMYPKTFERIRKVFKCIRGETRADYFKRLAEYLENEN